MKIISSDTAIYQPEQVKDINRKLRKYNITTRQEPDNGPAPGVTKSSHVFLVPCAEVMDTMAPFISSIKRSNGEFFGFDLYNYFEIDQFNYNVYDVGQEYGWHCDHNLEMHYLDIKLTCILNLSEEHYEGGDLVFFMDKEEILNPVPGGLTIFPSYISHRVTPVTSGKRITLSYWATGPAWK